MFEQWLITEKEWLGEHLPQSYNEAAIRIGQGEGMKAGDSKFMRFLMPFIRPSAAGLRYKLDHGRSVPGEAWCDLLFELKLAIRRRFIEATDPVTGLRGHVPGPDSGPQDIERFYGDLGRHFAERALSPDWFRNHADALECKSTPDYIAPGPIRFQNDHSVIAQKAETAVWLTLLSFRQFVQEHHSIPCRKDLHAKAEAKISGFWTTVNPPSSEDRGDGIDSGDFTRALQALGLDGIEGTRKPRRLPGDKKNIGIYLSL